MNEVSLTRVQLDALREISSIGAGNAATALSQFLNRKVEMSPPEIVGLSAASPLAPIPSTVSSLAIVALEAIGEVSGHIVVTFGLQNASLLIDSLMGKAWGATVPEALSEIDISAFKEVGSVMSASFLRVTGEMLGITIRMSTPYFATGPRESIGAFVVDKMIRDNHGILCMNSRLCIVDIGKVEGALLFFPSAASLPALLRLLGVA